MPPISSINFDKDDMVKFMLYQQFYYGNDRIFGRTRDMSVFIKGSGYIIDKFYELINKPIKLIEEGKYKEYLNFFNEKVHPIKVDEIYDELESKSEALGEFMEYNVKLTIVVGKALLEIHQTCFNKAIDEFLTILIRKKEEKFQYKHTEDSDKYIEKLKRLYSLSDPIIGLIYSLSFLRFIAKKMENENIYFRTEDLLMKYYKELAEYSDFNLIR